MVDIIMESVVQIVVTLMLTLIGVLGTWLTLKLGKKEELAAINVAQQEVIRLAHLTVEELQQTLVEGLKAAHEDGKLTKLELMPIEMHFDDPVWRSGNPRFSNKHGIIERLAEMSAPYGTKITVDERGYGILSMHNV